MLGIKIHIVIAIKSKTSMNVNMVMNVIVNMDMIVEETNAASSSWYETSGHALCQDANCLRWERNTAISYRSRRGGKMEWERNGVQWIQSKSRGGMKCIWGHCASSGASLHFPKLGPIFIHFG